MSMYMWWRNHKSGRNHVSGTTKTGENEGTTRKDIVEPSNYKPSVIPITS